MNKLSLDRRTKVIVALVEGNSICATCRMTDTAKGTVIRLLRDAGKAWAWTTISERAVFNKARSASL